jgi:hypothetical protein
MAALLRSGSRAGAGPTAPAVGLTLEAVEYRERAAESLAPAASSAESVAKPDASPDAVP